MFGFLRREGRSEDESQELAQEFFTRVLSGAGVSGADPTRGRFRSFLLGALRHFLADRRRHAQRQKRGGSVDVISIESGGTDSSPGIQVPDPGASFTDARFDREWALAVMEHALAAIQQEAQTSGKTAQFEALKPWLIGETENLSQESAAIELGMTTGAVKVAIHRLRRGFREAVKAEISQTIDDPDDLDEELQYLISALS